MRYVQLRAFHHVAVHGGFSRAAEALHVTQPAVSDQVRKLESEYDIHLFDRQKKQIRVTAEGQGLLDITHRLFDIEQQALDYLSESRASRTGTLRIIADSANHVTRTLARFRQAFPDVFISVKSGNSAQVLDKLTRYEADIGVLGNSPDTAHLDVVTLDSSPIIAFAPRDGAHGRRKSVSLRELASWPLVLREQGSKTRAKLEEQAGAAGLKLDVTIEAEGREAVRQIVAAGGGVGIVSEGEFSDDPTLAKIRIRDISLVMEETIVCLHERTNNPLIQRFMQLARNSGPST